MSPTRYAEYRPGLLGRLQSYWLRWRTRAERETADGRDYTGWRVRIISLPDPGMRPEVGTEGGVVGYEGDGSRREHRIDFGGEVWSISLPTRHLGLIPPIQ